MSRDIHYRKNYLSEVIARVDFASPILEVKEKLPKNITSEALKNFPIQEPRKIIAQELRFSAREFGGKQSESMEWTFHGRKREKKLVINPNAVFVQYFQFDRYETFKDEFLSVISPFLESFSDAQLSRIGLRYINNFEFNEAEPLNWESYINSRLLGNLNFFEVHEKAQLSRMFNVLDVNTGDFNLRIQFGMINPDHPAPIRKKEFTLDFDAFYQGAQEGRELTEKLNQFHTKIQDMFERSITDTLREKMNG